MRSCLQFDYLPSIPTYMGPGSALSGLTLSRPKQHPPLFLHVSAFEVIRNKTDWSVLSSFVNTILDYQFSLGPLNVIKSVKLLLSLFILLSLISRYFNTCEWNVIDKLYRDINYTKLLSPVNTTEWYKALYYHHGGEIWYFGLPWQLIVLEHGN